MLDIVLGADGTAMKWKDKVSVLVTDEIGRRKGGGGSGERQAESQGP